MLDHCHWGIFSSLLDGGADHYLGESTSKKSSTITVLLHKQILPKAKAARENIASVNELSFCPLRAMA